MSDIADRMKAAAQDAKDKSPGAVDAAKGKLDVNGDGKTDAADAKSIAKEAADKVKGMFHKS